MFSRLILNIQRSRAARQAKTVDRDDKDKKKRRLPPPISKFLDKLKEKLSDQLKKLAAKVSEYAQAPGKLLKNLGRLDPSKLAAVLGPALALATAVGGVAYAVANEREDERQVEQADIDELEATIGELEDQPAPADLAPALGELADRIRDLEGTDPATVGDLEDIADRLDDFATADELDDFATTDELDGLVDQAALDGLAQAAELEGLATAEELEGLASVDDLEGLIGEDALAGLATEAALDGLITAEALEGLVSEDQLEAVADQIPEPVTVTTVDLGPIIADVEAAAEAVAANQAALTAMDEAIQQAATLTALAEAVDAIQVEAEADVAALEASIGDLEATLDALEEFDPTALEEADAAILLEAQDALNQAQVAQVSAEDAVTAIETVSADLDDVERVFFADLVEQWEDGVPVDITLVNGCNEARPFSAYSGALSGFNRNAGTTETFCARYIPEAPILPRACSLPADESLLFFWHRQAAYVSASGGTTSGDTTSLSGSTGTESDGESVAFSAMIGTADGANASQTYNDNNILQFVTADLAAWEHYFQVDAVLVHGGGSASIYSGVSVDLEGMTASVRGDLTCEQ